MYKFSWPATAWLERSACPGHPRVGEPSWESLVHPPLGSEASQQREHRAQPRRIGLILRILQNRPLLYVLYPPEARVRLLVVRAALSNGHTVCTKA